jgi:lysophospholipase L1-like esterase
MMPERCGKTQLPSVLDTHAPLDLVVIMLGTNDLKHHLGLDAYDIANGAGFLVDLIRNSDAGPDRTAPAVLLVAPPAATEHSAICGHQFCDAVEKSLEFPKAFHAVSEDRGCTFFDAASCVTADDGDGLHLSADSHRTLGQALARAIRDA